MGRVMKEKGRLEERNREGNKGKKEEKEERYGELVKGGRNRIRKVRGATYICTVVMGKKDEEKDRY